MIKNRLSGLAVTILWLAVLSSAGNGQATPNSRPEKTGSESTLPPVFDVHWHPPGKTALPATLEAMKTLNVKYAVVLGVSSQLEEMKDLNPGAFIPALTFPCYEGKSANIGLPCFDDGGTFPNLSRLREDIKSGKVRAFGELNAQYLGIAPDDARLEPYFALAEELDVPVGLHLGIGPPGAAYDNKGFPPYKSPNYRGSAGNPLLLEEVLVKHPKLRIYAMHAAYPFRDEMVYMLYMHPQLYVDISGLQWVIPRPAYYGFLKTLVESGFAKRIMFGSDGSPARLKEGIQAIMEADFLSAEQKSDILYTNAAKFFRISENIK